MVCTDVIETTSRLTLRTNTSGPRGNGTDMPCHVALCLARVAHVPGLARRATSFFSSLQRQTPPYETIAGSSATPSLYRSKRRQEVESDQTRLALYYLSRRVWYDFGNFQIQPHCDSHRELHIREIPQHRQHITRYDLPSHQSSHGISKSNISCLSPRRIAPSGWQSGLAISAKSNPSNSERSLSPPSRQDARNLHRKMPGSAKSGRRARAQKTEAHGPHGRSGSK